MLRVVNVWVRLGQVGGFSSRELIRLLRSMKGLNVVSGDVVEVAPAYDHAGKRGNGLILRHLYCGFLPTIETRAIVTQ